MSATEPISIELELGTDSLLFPATFHLVPVAGNWDDHPNPIYVKDDFLRTITAACKGIAEQNREVFANLADLHSSIVSVNVSIASKPKPFKVTMVFKDSAVACNLVMLLESTHVWNVPARAGTYAEAAAGSPTLHPSKIAVKSAVTKGSFISTLIAQEYNILHISPVQCFGPREMTIILGRAAARDGWMTELRSLDFGKSVSVSAIEDNQYPRGYFRAVIKTSPDCHPVPRELNVDTSKIKISDERIKLPPKLTFQIRARFGAAAPPVPQEQHQESHIASGSINSKRQRTDATADLI